ncbi:MAG: hypothetical protein KBS91_02960, partial [Firmicutes bacterium]|nr:hypothetical protein [Candidatus Caballimonas caccae]
LPEGKDPDEVIKEFGKDAYQNLLDSAMPLIDFKLDIVKRTFDINSVDGKRKYIQNAIKVIKESPSPSEQEDLLKTVRDLTGITLDSLKRELYSTEVKKESESIEIKTEFNENVGDRETVAGRFILASYLFNKPFAEETDIEDIEFTHPIHREIKEYIISCRKDNLPIRFNDLYQIINESDTELSLIAGLETDENKRFDQSIYFADCIKTIKTEQINKEIQALSKLCESTTETAKRLEYTKMLSELIKKKNQL